ncbi:hypothetical protein WJX74_000575 [Apatococcus lobatus]|uniref:NAD(P)H dehydrogenase (quinone) n=1 Tax=Apatococcus lobatus TaxID=904363 RepID=A0AAW1RTV9_9CHLO
MGCGSSKTKDTDPPARQTGVTSGQSAPATAQANKATPAQATQPKSAAPASSAAGASTAAPTSTSTTTATSTAPAAKTAEPSAAAKSTAQTPAGAGTAAKEATASKETATSGTKTTATPATTSPPTTNPASTSSAIATPATTSAGTTSAITTSAVAPAVVSEPHVGRITDPAPTTGSVGTTGTTVSSTQPAGANVPASGLSRGAQLAAQAEAEQLQKATRSCRPRKGAMHLTLSTYGHILEMARAQLRGVQAVAGVAGQIYQVPETLPAEVLQKMHSPPKPWEGIPIADAQSLPQADGFLLGTPTRFGNVSGQFKQFWDSTGSLWQKGSLHGKPFGMFVSTATQGGGQEETFRSAISNFVHHGMIFVPAGNSFGPQLFDVETLHGGSAWGAGTFAGATGARQPSQLELDIAEHQGRGFAEVVKKLKHF